MNAGTANSKLDTQTPQSAFLLARAQREGLLRHFGFRESPFGVTPDPEFLFWSRMHRAALQGMIASIESNLGFSVLLGKPGTGKTSLLFHLLAQYRETARTAFIFQTQCRPHDLIRHIASELDLPTGRRDDVSLHQNLNGMLLKEARAGRKVLIIIDEAQNLQSASLEAVRLLSDFETGFSKLLNVVLSGSPRLGEMLLTSELSQLAQRISTISRLESLSREEVMEYVRFRLAVVATRPNEGLFAADSLAEIASQSGGIPRVINSICYRALMLAYTQGKPAVSREFVQEAARDLDFSEPGTEDSRMAIQFTVPDAPLSDALPAVPRENHVPANGESASSGLRPGPIAPGQAFVEKKSATGVDARTFAQTAHSPPRAKGPGVNWGGQATSANPDKAARIRLPASNRLQSVWWDRYWSSGLIALLALLALVSWLSWNELRAKPSATGEYVSRGQPESLRRQVQPSAPELNNAAPQISMQQHDAVAPQPTDTNPAQSSGSRGQPPIDVRSNLLLPSKIQSQPSTAVQPVTGDSVEIKSNAADNLPMMATNTPVVPRLEAPKPVAGSSPKTTFSPQPISVIQPEYPPKARLWHIEGEVFLEITIDRNGNVQKVRSLSGNAILLQAAEDAIRRWKYLPASADQVSAPTVTRVRFNFKLDPEAGH